MISKTLFWASIFLLFHSYILYPFLLKIIYWLKPKRKVSETGYSFYPTVSILMAVYNEEKVIRQKIESVFSANYPKGEFGIFVGSDGSSDQTNNILTELSKKHKNLSVHIFKERMGKANVINRLADRAKGEIFILTDANVLFDENTISELVTMFRDQGTGLVDTNMINRGLKKDGISIQEKAYISMEVKTKNLEGKIWGTMMGPMGGCYAIRRELYLPVPDNLLVDDFYINMKVLQKGKKAINNLNAKVYEDVSNDLGEEFRRKTRIATGDFQNFKLFFHLLWPPFRGLAFSFLSHKILRWFGPLFFFIVFFLNLVLAFKNTFYLSLFILQCILFILPFIDYFLRKIEIHVLILRFITHFWAMNVALLFGFVKFITGVKINVWQPTKRQQV
ncbi:MAG: glycosyltransferase [Bacteroidales bacterium]|nr:glycosyltransferase [Bacteroidales bacterium]